MNLIVSLTLTDVSRRFITAFNVFRYYSEVYRQLEKSAKSYQTDNRVPNISLHANQFASAVQDTDPDATVGHVLQTAQSSKQI
jgi:hypothetical protein